MFNKVFTGIWKKYYNYINILSLKNMIKLLEHTSINNDTIRLKKDKQSLFKYIYSVEPMKLEMMKTYIKINLINSFI